MKNFYAYTGPTGQRLHGYNRKYKKQVLRKRGFVTKGEAESSLRAAMSDIDAALRGEVRLTPTTAQDALDIYRRNLDVRSRDKQVQYAHTAAFTCKILQEFVDRFGPTRLVREITSTDLREFYQVLCFRMTRNSAGLYIGNVQGMLKAAQDARPDLVNWLRPKLTVRRDTENERRVVEPHEYAALVQQLLNPPARFKTQCETVWREAADLVQLLRLTGGRLNEVLRMKIDQVHWSKGVVRLYATKTEREREIPLSAGIRRVLNARMSEGLCTDYVFPRATVASFDKRIGKVVRRAASRAGLAYGLANGFTLHSLRHTFITDLMEKTNRDVGLVMQYSGHRSLQSFSIYLHATTPGRELAIQALDRVDPFMYPSAGNEGQQGHKGQQAESAKVLKIKQVAV
jgi:integrase